MMHTNTHTNIHAHTHTYIVVQIHSRTASLTCHHVAPYCKVALMLVMHAESDCLRRRKAAWLMVKVPMASISMTVCAMCVCLCVYVCVYLCLYVCFMCVCV